MGRRVLKKFDQYLLLDCIAIGGMAEIFRARPMKSGGAGRILVIKRIIKDYSEKPEFRAMFKSEIKALMGMNHPNITQLHDYGKARNTLFIAMEYVEGKSLRQILRGLKKKGDRLPVAWAVHICEQVARGLHYAHQFRNRATGEYLSLVHRDVTPQNILVSFEEGTKIIDFGIAKAKTNLEDTLSGIIKGKPNYVSPEQIAGKKLDPRSDIFSLGTVLWEALAGRKLFAVKKDKSGFDTMKLIESCEKYIKPPSSYNPLVSPGLDEVVLKMLQKDREKRYQTAEDVQRDLHRLLYSEFPDFNPADLKERLHILFHEDIEKDRKWIQYLTRVGERLIQHYQKRTDRKEEGASESVSQLTMRTSGAEVELQSDLVKVSTQSRSNIHLGPPANLVRGARVPEFQAITSNGKVIDIKDYLGKKVWLAFYRYATCPYSLLHLSEVVAKAEELKQNGVEFIAVFKSDLKEFKSGGPHASHVYLQDVPFPMITDPNRKLYRFFGVKQGIRAWFSVSLWWSFIKAWFKGFGPGGGGFSEARKLDPQLPAHFLILEDGRIHTIHQGATFSDHISWWRVQKFFRERRTIMGARETQGAPKKAG